MACVCVSVENCKNWEKAGRNEFLKACKGIIQNEKEASVYPKAKKIGKDLKRAIYELCWHYLRSNLKIDQVTSSFADIVGLHSNVVSTLTDVLAVIDTETVCMEVKPVRERFFNLLISSKGVIPDKLIKERFDSETLGDINLITNKKAFHTKFIKIKTKLFYKQQKFNLLREESEGYAKLITELNQELTEAVTTDYLLEVIKSLIGCFNLDPNRVLDIILESFECRPEHCDFFIPLLLSYMCDRTTLCEVLGFKFQRESQEGYTLHSLYKVTALMLQHDLIDLEAIYCQLKPKDPDIYEHHKKSVSDANAYVKKLNMVSSAAEKQDQKDDDRETEMTKFNSNQKLGLCQALLQIGDWEHSRWIMDRLPESYAASFTPIRQALCRLITYIMEPVYRSSQRPTGLSKVVKTKRMDVFHGKRALKQFEKFGDLNNNFFSMVCALGPHVHADPVLMVKIIRLARSYLLDFQKSKMSNGIVDGLKHDFMQVIEEVLLPSLSLMTCNCAVAEELWSLLKLYPYQDRYYLYAQWKNETYENHPLLIRARGDCMKKIKYTMKRLSKENIKPSGRNIGKFSHSNPGFLFDYILNQIQSWSNLIGPVVDSLKYLTNLSYDVFAYCIIEALANPDKQRMKHDGTTISVWLQSLSTFCGAVFKKYSIELTGLLQYVANQLKAENSLDLLILKEIVQKMAGIEALEEMTNDQLDAMGGGELLRAEGGYFSLSKNTKKSSQRLKEALLDQDLALPLCLLMGQQRNCIIYKEETGHVKLLGKLYDQCQDTLVQFGSFLSSSLSVEDYVRRLPSVDALMSEYHLMADVAFFLSQPLFSHAISSKYDELRKQEKVSKLSSNARIQKYLEIVESVKNSVVESVKPLHPPKVWEDISPQFYVTFWSLSMFDLHVPVSSYQKEASKLKAQISQIEENKDMVQSKKKKEIERCKALMDKMMDEQKKQRDHCERTLAHLKHEKDSWFLSRSAKNDTITQFLQLCVFPRCIFTGIDALYCANFVHTIHNLKTPNFSTLMCYDRIFCDITYTVTACSENEAGHYGRFLCAMLETVMRWHSSKEIFEKECADYPGFVTKFRIANQTTESANDHVDYENYRHVCHKWHFKITKALLTCLSSGDYVQIRNSLHILIRVLPYYPVVSNLARVVEQRVESVREAEKQKRPDLYAVALSYLGLLKNKKSSLIPEQEFHLKETKDVAKSQANAKPDGASTTTTNSQANAKTRTSQNTGALKDSNENLRAEKSREQLTKNGLKEKRVPITMKSDSRTDSKPATGNQSRNQSTSSKSSNNSTGTNQSSHNTNVKRDSSGVRISEKDGEHGYDKSGDKRPYESKDDRNSVNRDDKSYSKEDKSYKDDHSRYDKLSHKDKEDGKERSRKEDREEKRHAKEDSQDSHADRSPSVGSNNSGNSHSQRRSIEPPESDRDTKRRKMDHPARSGKTTRHEEKLKDPEKEKSKDRSREKSRSRELEHEAKQKEKKQERKRDRIEENMLGEIKKRKEESSAKSSSRQNGESERDKERHKKEGSSDRSRERKAMEEDMPAPSPRRGRSSYKKSRKAV